MFYSCPNILNIMTIINQNKLNSKKQATHSCGFFNSLMYLSKKVIDEKPTTGYLYIKHDSEGKPIYERANAFKLSRDLVNKKQGRK